MKQSVVNPRYAKTREYGGVIRRIAEEGKCPFCPDNFKYHKHPILKRRGRWFITRSSWPYQNTKLHLLIIGERHRERFGELTAADWKHIVALANWAIAKFYIRGGAFALRFGETAYTGATVVHLHVHLIVPKVGRKKTKFVSFPIG